MTAPTRVVFAMIDRHADRSTPQVSIGRLPALDMLKRELESRGYQCVPLDAFSPTRGAETIVLWDYGSLTNLPRPLADAARGRIVAWSLESPLVAHRSFHRLAAIASSSRYVFAFPGAQRLLPEHSNLHALYWPTTAPSEIPDEPWSDRQFLAMINSDKGVGVAASLGEADVRDPWRSLRVVASAAIGKSYRVRSTWTVPNYYNERLEAIRHFAGRDGFHLFGSGWHRRTRRPGRFGARLTASYKGTVDDKIVTLSRYRFTLCYENTSFDGYITEKIFDAFFARTIPVYLGAPDIAAYIPEDAFIDVQRFDGYDALEARLRSMTRDEAEAKLCSAAEFIKSASFTRFTAGTFVDDLAAAIQEIDGRASNE